MFLSYDNNGALQVHDRQPTHALVETLTAGMPSTKIPLARGHRMIGWANNVALLRPEKFHRNPVAACVLAALGATKQPYVGPIVITGFLYDQQGDLLELTETQSSEIEHLDQAARAAVANQPIPGEVERCLDLHPDWANSMRAYAQQVTNDDISPSTPR